MNPLERTGTMEKNNEKYEAYKAMKMNLNKAMKSGFYYQAIFIEYAIIEDRCLSVLKHAGVKYLDSKGHEISLKEKLRKMKGNPAFLTDYVRKRITSELIDEIETWKTDRNQLVHALAKIPYNNDSIREVAERGQTLINTLDNKVRSANRFFDKNNS